MSSTATRDTDGTKARTRAPAESLLAGGRRAATGTQSGGRRHRSWGLVTLAALLVVGTALAVAAWGLHAGQRESVLTIGQPVAKGHTIVREDLVSTAVSGVPGAIPVDQVSSVVGKTAVVDLVDGQILTAGMLTSSPVPAEGQATVGLALDPARVPGAGLDAGDVVDVIAVPVSDSAQSDPGALNTPEVLVRGAQVFAVQGAATGGGQVLVTLVVPSTSSARVAAYAAQNRVAVVETAAAGAGR